MPLDARSYGFHDPSGGPSMVAHGAFQNNVSPRHTAAADRFVMLSNQLCRPLLSLMSSSNSGQCCITHTLVRAMQHQPQSPGAAAGRDGVDVRFANPP